mmetsp:Transcript_27767/g.67433  ORF Transcript_27767/g.67433 Transcript_27767/m.67433 type:complete len:83 (+) Transcript_27767:152-400(+)
MEPFTDIVNVLPLLQCHDNVMQSPSNGEQRLHAFFSVSKSAMSNECLFFGGEISANVMVWPAKWRTTLLTLTCDIDTSMAQH